MLEAEGGEGVGGDGADDEEQVEEGQGQQRVVERVFAHLLAERQTSRGGMRMEGLSNMSL